MSKSFNRICVQVLQFIQPNIKWSNVSNGKWFPTKWRRRLTCHRFVFSAATRLMARLTCQQFFVSSGIFFCVTNKPCLFLPHQNCKWGCAKIEQILKINNHMHASRWAMVAWIYEVKHGMDFVPFKMKINMRPKCIRFLRVFACLCDISKEWEGEREKIWIV